MARKEIKEIQIGNQESDIYDIKDEYARNKINQINNSITELNNKWVGLPIKNGNDAKILSVAKNNTGMFNTINDAFVYAHNNLNPSSDNRATIIIYPGVYHEHIEADEWNYIDFIGLDRDSCIIEYPSTYPTCVIHVHGDNTFKNLTIKSTSPSSYCVHADYLNNTSGYVLTFDNCYFLGGSNAIGHGSSQNSHLIIKNCEIEGNQTPVYFHNCPYSNTTNQKVTLLDNIIHPVNGYAMLIDDSAGGYGATNSYLFVTCNGNVVPELSANILFRPYPGSEQYDRKYIGDDTQVKLTTSSEANFNEAIDYGGGQYNLTTYVVLPNSPDDNGYYRTGLLTGSLYATKYNRELQDVTLPGVGSITNQFGLGAVTDHSIELSTQNSSCAGKCVSVSVKLSIG